MAKKPNTKKQKQPKKDLNPFIKHSSVIAAVGFLSFFAGYHLYKEDQFKETYHEVGRVLDKDNFADEYHFVVNIPGTGGASVNMMLAEALDEDEYINYPSNIEALGNKQDCHKLKYEDKIYATGYMNFGLHCDLAKYKYYTMLREPNDRVLALFSSIASQSLDLKTANRLDLRRELVKFLSDKELRETDNGMVRRLSDAGYRVSYGKVTQKHLQQAKQNLKKKFAAIGIYKDVGKFNISLEYQLEKEINHSFQTTNDIKFDTSIITQKEMDYIAKNNALDIELYNFALDLQPSRYNELPKEKKEKYIELYSPHLTEESKEEK